MIRQFLLNTALMLDLFGNSILLGDPRETISHRTARAREAGSIPACYFCSFLTFIANRIITKKRDHCTWALSSDDSVGQEIWKWSDK
jgi:hypothetical protein